MATSEMSGVIQRLRRIVLLRDGAGLTDGQLLEDYIGRRDEAALAALVHRHGPMVWGVCSRVLRNYHDAEDAFQATFLVFVRKAASIASRELLANWLYGVAHQTALKARATAAKRKGRERQVTEMPEPAMTEQDLWRDLQPLLDEELSRLPDKYRSVIVLCDLEGKTRKEAARQLGCPDGTVGGWLARARVMLAKRLAQRGVALSGGALAAVFSQKAASAGVPLSVVSSTIKAATLFAAGQAAAGVISVKVAALTEGVLKAMFLTKLKTVSVVLLVVAALCGSAGLIYQTQAAEPPKPQAATGQTNKDKNGSLNEQVKAQTEEARAKVEEMNQALWNAEYGKAVDLMPPYLIEKQGGREKMLGTMKRVMEKMKSRFTLRSYKVGDPFFFVRGSARCVVFTTTTELGWAAVVDGIVSDPQSGTVATSQAFAVAISQDNGKTWKFVNGDQHAFRDHVEDFFGAWLRLPTLSTVEAEGPELPKE